MNTVLVRIKFSVFLLITVCIFLSSCNSPNTKLESVDSLLKHTYREDVSWVDTTHTFKGVFNKELISNGKLQAVRKAGIKFRIAESISSIKIKNGQRVKRGQVLAILESFTQENAVEQAQQALEKAEIDMKDAFISYGYSEKDSSTIPNNIIKVAQTKSGFLKAQSDFKKAKYELFHTRLNAPFSGVIANLEAQIFNQADVSKPFCILIDDSKLEASFSVLESEITEISLGQKVEITPFSISSTYKGKISEINPLVDENAMMKVKALIKNKDRKLISGMNVKIRIAKEVPNQLIIPKTALVLRQGRPVVFTWKNDTAIWKYVEPGLENSSQFSIKSGLEANDIVITSGNLNLAHKSPVQISKNK